jgi:sugar diacid utilization regulator
LVAIHDRLGALVLQGADATAITVALSELVDRPVILLDTMLRAVAQQSNNGDASSLRWEPTEAYVGRVLQTIAGERRSMRLPPLPAWGVNYGCVLAPVVAGDAVLGYLAILEPEVADAEPSVPAEADLLAAQHAASVYALALMRERLAAEVTTELRDELLEGLLDGQVTDEQATRERARRLGYDDSLVYQVLTLLPDQTSERDQPYAGEGWSAGWRRRVLDAVAQLVRERAVQAIVTRRREELVVLLPESSEPSPSDLGRTVTLYVASMYPEWPLTVGVGGVCRAPREIARSYAQARRAAEVAQRFGRRGEVASFDDLGFYRLLFQISDRNELRAFVDQVLGPLLAYDHKHRTDFVQTIATYLSNNNSLQATAKELYVHVNTAAYRLQRIQSITGLDLSKTEDCLLARVALMILEDEDAG